MDRKWWTLIVVGVGTFMLLLDVTIVLVALPDVQHGLHASFSDLQWVVDAYALTLASLLLTTGVLADRYGRHQCGRMDCQCTVDDPVSRRGRQYYRERRSGHGDGYVGGIDHALGGDLDHGDFGRLDHDSSAAHNAHRGCGQQRRRCDFAEQRRHCHQRR